MNIFLLSPINIDAPEWAVSSIVAPVQVLAEDEPQARFTAADELCLTRWMPGSAARAERPWLRLDRAVARRIRRTTDSFPLLEGMARIGRPGRVPRQLFLLTPVNVAAPEWELSMVCTQICVKAMRVGQARAIAAMFMSAAPAVQPQRADLYPPWWQPRLVMVEKIEEAPEGISVIDASSTPLRFQGVAERQGGHLTGVEARMGHRNGPERPTAG